MENPRWGDIKNGILAENTRVLKVFLEEDGEIKVYPFIVDKITDKRDSHFSVYKEIEANGLAFAELGKQGYKIELNSHTAESDLEKDKNTVTTMQYWLDKVFPNEKDSNGNIIKWLTPWCYELRMDWSHYTAANRASNKIYEDSYVSSWALKNEDNPELETTLEPAGFEEGLEKARPVECVNSNKYNITQTLAETFGVFCVYEYKCDNRGQFIGTYYEKLSDDCSIAWTGRKVIFYNRAIKTDKPVFVDYQNNLTSISRTSDSTELYTKLYVTPVQSELTETGYVSIADTDVNPLLDDFILNFDYLYSKGSITDYQYNYLNTYRIELYRLNNLLRNASPELESLSVEINELKAKAALIQKEIDSAKQTAQEYATLRDNDVTNAEIIKDKDNAYSVVFSIDQDCYSAKIRLDGVNGNSIKGYDSYKYTNEIFSLSKGNLIVTQSSKRLALTEANHNFYVLLDDYGYPTEIYTSLGNPLLTEGKTIIYLALTYSPSNAYITICSWLEEMIAKKTATRNELEKILGQEDTTPKTGKFLELEEKETKYNSILAEKEALNRKFELIMGPALREGYWTPDTYEDPGQKIEQFDLQGFKENALNAGAELIYDSEYFDEEETGYYYDDIFSDEKKYYSYIRIKDIYKNWSNQNLDDLVIHLLNPSIIYVVQNSALPIGNYFILYNSTKYYFTLSSQQEVGTKFEIKKVNNNLYLYINDAQYATLSTVELANAANLTDRFEGLNNYLGERLLYNNAGFIITFIKLQTEIEPVLLLNENSINYKKYTTIGYSFGDSTTIVNLTVEPATEYTLYYPRIIISEKNVNYKSDLFTIETYTGTYASENSKKLTRYQDYVALVRSGKPHITLKINNSHNLSDILDGKYYLFYQISRANEMLYLDAKEVARENSQPKYSYELTIANIPDEVAFIDLGQLVYINDHALGVHAATGYVSGMKLALDKPQDDELTIQNYKTKFEDLFSTITASSEAMKNNAVAYNIAAAGFAPNGQIEGSVLQTSINNNNISFNFSNTNVQIDDTQGIILTNTSPYMNGVYGQVALRGGGIFLSNTIDETGNRIWSTGITPTGINASMITTGQLDTNTIRIFAGNNLAFQWNPEGIFAYTRGEDGTPNLSRYVRYSDKGLQYIDGEFTAVDLGWNGLLISTQGGSTELTGDKGLTVYYGQKNDAGNNYAVRVGHFNQPDEDGSYGLRLYNRVGDDYIPTLVSSNKGELWLKSTLRIGSETKADGSENRGIAGITGDGVTRYKEDGVTVESSPVRFWAGDIDKDMAPFQVLEDGTVSATKAIIEGSITAKTGFIGGWVINETDLTSGNMSISSSNIIGENETSARRLTVTDPTTNEVLFGVYNDGSFVAEKAVISGTIYADSGKIGNYEVEGLEKDLQELLGNPNQLNVQIISTKGTVANADYAFLTTFQAILYKGNIEVEDSEYSKYLYYWEYSQDNADWISFFDKDNYTDDEENPVAEDVTKFTTEPYYQYNNILGQSIFVRCRVELKSDGGESDE